MKKLLLLSVVFIALSLCSISGVNAQGVGINSSGNSPDNSAIFDISSTDRGLLIPRMTIAQRDAINLPAKGLQIYNIECNNFYYNAGTPAAPNWIALNPTPDTPLPAGTISGPSSVCQGQSGVSFSVPSITHATSYIWSYSGSGATISGTTSLVTIDFASNATPGDLSVYGSSVCGNGTASAAYSITFLSPPVITGQPASATTYSCSGSATFTVAASGTGLTYQWQEFISSWNNIINGGVYSGATLATLTITNPSTSMDGYKYRCIVSGTCSPPATTDGLATLTVMNSSAGRVSYWTLDGNTNDASGSGNNGSNANVTFTTGKVNQAGSFNGGSSRIIVNENVSLALSNITISTWIKTTANSGGYMVIMRRSAAFYEGYLVFLVPSSGTPGAYIGKGSGSDATLNSTTIVNDGNWHLITMTYDGAILRLYVDGGNMVSASVGGPIYNSGILNIGYDVPNSGYYYSGLLDDIQIYNRALSAAEVQNLYLLTPCP